MYKIKKIKRPTCPWCNPLKIDDNPELRPSGQCEPKVLECPMKDKCRGITDKKRPPEFNYFDASGKPIPYTPQTKHTAGYSPQKARDPRKGIVKNPFKNSPAIDGEGENPGKMFSLKQCSICFDEYPPLYFDNDPDCRDNLKTYCKKCRQEKQRAYYKRKLFKKENDRIYEIASMFDIKPSVVRTIYEMMQ